MVSSKKFVATQNISMSGGPIVGDIFVRLVLDSKMCIVLEIPVQQHPAGEKRQRGAGTQAEEDDAYKT